MEQQRVYGSISRGNHDHDHDWETNKDESRDRLDISLSSSYQEYDMTYLIAPTLSFPQKMERCFRFTVPLLIGALFLWAAAVLFSSSAVRCGGYPTDPKFCFQKDDTGTTQTIQTNGLESGTMSSHNVSAAPIIHTKTMRTTTQDTP